MKVIWKYVDMQAPPGKVCLFSITKMAAKIFTEDVIGKPGYPKTFMVNTDEVGTVASAILLAWPEKKALDFWVGKAKISDAEHP